MSEAHADAHHGPNVRGYLIVFAALSVFTVVSFVINDFVRGDKMSAMSGMLIILAVAVVKAVLVGAYFMHLKYDWGRVFFMIVPAFILATMMIFVLLPDIVLAWK
jgi:cytochrome c oxidase subunit 4